MTILYRPRTALVVKNLNETTFVYNGLIQVYTIFYYRSIFDPITKETFHADENEPIKEQLSGKCYWKTIHILCSSVEVISNGSLSPLATAVAADAARISSMNGLLRSDGLNDDISSFKNGLLMPAKKMRNNLDYRVKFVTSSSTWHHSLQMKQPWKKHTSYKSINSNKTTMPSYLT